MSVFPDFKRLAFRKMENAMKNTNSIQSHFHSFSQFPRKSLLHPNSLRHLGALAPFGTSRQLFTQPIQDGLGAQSWMLRGKNETPVISNVWRNRWIFFLESLQILKLHGQRWRLDLNLLDMQSLFVKFQWNHSESCFHVFVFVMFDLCKSWRLQHSVYIVCINVVLSSLPQAFVTLRVSERWNLPASRETWKLCDLLMLHDCCIILQSKHHDITEIINMVCCWCGTNLIFIDMSLIHFICLRLSCNSPCNSKPVNEVLHQHPGCENNFCLAKFQHEIYSKHQSKSWFWTAIMISFHQTFLPFVSSITRNFYPKVGVKWCEVCSSPAFSKQSKSVKACWYRSRAASRTGMTCQSV